MMHDGYFNAIPARSKNTATGYSAKAHFLRAGEKDTPFIQMFLRVVDEDCENESVRWKGWLSPDALEYTVADLRNFGWNGVDLSELCDEDLCKKVQIKVTSEKYEGKTYFEVEYVNAIGEGLLKSERVIEGKDLVRFAAGLKDRIEQLRGVPQRTKAPANENQGEEKLPDWM